MNSHDAPLKSPIHGKCICVTGTLRTSRAEVQANLTNAGAIVTDDVSSRTDILVVGEKAGSKLAKAKKLGIQILDQDQLDALLSTKTQGNQLLSSQATTPVASAPQPEPDQDIDTIMALLSDCPTTIEGIPEAIASQAKAQALPMFVAAARLLFASNPMEGTTPAELGARPIAHYPVRSAFVMRVIAKLTEPDILKAIATPLVVEILNLRQPVHWMRTLNGMLPKDEWDNTYRASTFINKVWTWAVAESPTQEVLSALVQAFLCYNSVTIFGGQVRDALVACGSKAVSAIAEGLKANPKAEKRGFLIDALARIAAPEGVEALIAALNDSSKGNREMAIQGLITIGEPAHGALSKVLELSKGAVREAVGRALEAIGPVDRASQSTASIDPGKELRTKVSAERVARAVSMLDKKEPLRPDDDLDACLLAYIEKDRERVDYAGWPNSVMIQRFANHPALPWLLVDAFFALPPEMGFGPIRHKLNYALQWMDPQLLVAPMVQRLTEVTPKCAAFYYLWLADNGVTRQSERAFLRGLTMASNVRTACVKALVQIGEPCVAGLIELLGDKSKDVRLAAATALAEIGSPASRKPIQQALASEKNTAVRAMLDTALKSN